GLGKASRGGASSRHARTRSATAGRPCSCPTVACSCRALSQGGARTSLRHLHHPAADGPYGPPRLLLAKPAKPGSWRGSEFRLESTEVLTCSTTTSSFAAACFWPSRRRVQRCIDSSRR